MSDTIGRITVPSVTASAVFPLRTEFPHGSARRRTVITHQFGSANAKIEQRFFVGDGATRYTFHRARLNNSDRVLLRNFWEARQGAAGAFFYDVPNPDQSFTRKTVCFENAPLSFEELSDTVCSVGVTFVEIPDPAAAPVYSLGATVARFPNGTLTTALLDQVQEIIPLVRIRVLDSAVPDILLSDRRVTIRDTRVGSTDYLYLPRLLRVGEPGASALMTQSIDGSSDDVSFSFGNADRVMVQVANDTQLRWARVELSLYHVGSTVRLDLWAGYILDWQSDAGPEFSVRASDILSALTLSSPVSTISRQCWRRLGQDGCPWNSGSDTRDLVHFPAASTTVCDLGYNTANGCLAHGVQSGYGATYCAPQGVLLRSGGIGFGFSPLMLVAGLAGGIQSVSTWYPRTSMVLDSIYGANLPEIWHHDEGVPQYGLPVLCKIAAGRDEDQFYAALGIVGKGPLGAFTAPAMVDTNADGIKETFVGSTLDGSPNHGFQVDSNGNLKSGVTPTLGLRQVLGSDPAGAHDYFSLGRVSATGVGWFQQPSDNSWMEEVAYAGSAYNLVFAAGVAFCEIRRTKPNSDPLTSPGQHTMMATISQGLTAYTWTGPTTQTTTPGCTNPFWVAVNTFLSALGILGAAHNVQEDAFDVPSAIACAAIADTTVAKVIGSGTETQFRFKGVIDDRKPTRDWLQSVLNSGCGYYTWSFGKLKVGIRGNASAVSAFTAGNMLFQSLQLTPIKPRFEKLTVSFADQEYQFQGNTVDYTDQDLAARNLRVQNPLAGQFALSGCATKSQAGRIAVIRTREETGGTTQAEQDAARIAAWKTTILGLDTEAGMVVSVADADVPGATGNFRIQRWVLNRDWSIDIQGQTVVASMYDLATGPKPADVAPAPIPTETLRDEDKPDAPSFGVEVNDLDSLAVEIAGIAFSDPKNTHTITSARFQIWYTDPAAVDYLVGTALTSGAGNVILGSTPTTLAAGDYIQIGAEILLCGTPSGATVPVTRHQLGSPAASASVGDVVQKIFVREVTAAFAPGTFDGGDSGDWSEVVRIPETKVAAVTGWVTNGYGDSPATDVCTTVNVDHGLPLTAPAVGSSADAVVNVTNANMTLSAGPQIVNVVATSVDCILTLPPDSSMPGYDIKVNLSPGSTHNAILRPHSGDTISGSGSDYTISTPGSGVIIEAT